MAPVDPGLVRFLDADGALIDPTHDPNVDPETLVAIHRAMVRTRIIDLQLEKLQRQGRIAFHVSSLGEEAAIVASAAALADEDWLVPCYREVGALFYRGYALEAYLDMMFGNAADVAHGRQMPAHTTSRAHRYASVSAPIGTQIPHAVGMAYALRLRGASEVVAVYFGEGATSSNDFHAGLNLAGVWRVPVLFLCRNNRWAISLPSEEQTASTDFASKAVAYGLPGVRCDGNDVLAVLHVVREARARALAGQGATLIELVTYRKGGHSTSDDASLYREASEVAAAAALDPIERSRRYLVARGLWDDAVDAAYAIEVSAALKRAIALAEAKPKPKLETLFDDVYAERPAHLEAQLRELLEAPRHKSTG